MYYARDLGAGGTARTDNATGAREEGRNLQPEQLTIKQTATGYWVVQQGAMHLAGAMTREAAEAERELLTRLRTRSVRRLPADSSHGARRQRAARSPSGRRGA